MTFLSIINWLTLEDYSEAKREAARRIIAKQSRGNIVAQDGEVMLDEELQTLSRKADDSLRRLRDATAGVR